MSQLPIIELCISLVFVFFVLSVMVSAIGEVVNTVLPGPLSVAKHLTPWLKV